METAEHELRRAFLAKWKRSPAASDQPCSSAARARARAGVLRMDSLAARIDCAVRAGDIQSILASRTIWICASCYSCTTRCPAGIKVTDIIYALKRNGAGARHPAVALPHVRGGRVVPGPGQPLRPHDEPRFMLGFYRRAGFGGRSRRCRWRCGCFSGRIGIKASRIKGLDQLRKIHAPGRAAGDRRGARGDRAKSRRSATAW